MYAWFIRTGFEKLEIADPPGTYQASGMGVDSVTERRFGLQHSMLLAPSVKFAVGADRDVISGDYEMRANISMPVDAFMRGRWLG
ncbi:hypothetical protein L557_2887, partial [Bordetella pertussis STO1-CNMC-0004]